MNIEIIVTHKLGFTYSLCTRTSDKFCELDAIADAVRWALVHFGLLPAPFDFKIKVVK